MNKDVQRRRINQFLKGKGRKEIDAFCVYQWIDRCHFEEWWDSAIALGSFIPPNSLSQDYQKRIEFLLGQCRNQINQRNDQFIEIGNSQDSQAFPLPKVFIDTLEELGLKLEGRGQNRMKLKYLDKRLLFLEKMTFETCTFYFIDRSCDSLLTWLENNGFDYLADGVKMTKKAADESRPRMRISWDDATSLLPALFTREYLDEIEIKRKEKFQKSDPSSKKNQFGHRLGSQAAKIDELLLAGNSIPNIALIIGSTYGRVRNHIKHLLKHGIDVRATRIGNNGSIYKIVSLEAHSFAVTKEISPFGHEIGSAAAEIDFLLMEGITEKSAAALTGKTPSQIRSYMRYLRKKGINVQGTTVTNEGILYKINSSYDPEEYWEYGNNSPNLGTLRVTFWNKFKEYAQQHSTSLKLGRTYPEHYYDIRFGFTKCHICLTLNTKNDLITCELYIPDSKSLFHKLLEYRDSIEATLREDLEWHELPEKKASRIKLLKHADVVNNSNWDEYLSWLMEKAESFREVFSKYI